MKVDAVVLGAGIIGVSIAAHLQKRGRSVALVDRRGAGQETSYGNAGLIQREGVYPYGFPHDFGALLRYATNRTIDAHYHLSALPKLAPFLFRYWLNSRASHHEGIARQYAKLIEHCVVEHRELAREAGVGSLLRPIGWLKLFRTTQERDARLAEADEWRRHFGVESLALDQAALRAAEPHIDQSLIGALHFTQPDSCSDPGALADGYRKYVETLGGKFLIGDAKTLEANGDGWRVTTQEGAVEAGSAVVALGPWADLVTIKLGYALPLAVKRGYHMHYKAQGNATLNHPMLDVERGYFIAPMARGIRLTTGAEFADRDAPKTPVQLKRAEPIARSLFPLAERVDSEPWMGCRPCTPDMMPVIGPAPKHRNLWFAFGHAHHGLTLGAVTGRLIAEMMTGEAPFVDPNPFRADRPGMR
ncbi:FAD-dependent oxidoreductase [Terrarubrum flagellatum]|uniref:NAD(P)/FAD-dependent oxidoreductase n=1 Tax=Terrirubrum flagellatum TaxID=2895980 RepID=UPI00314553E0